MNVAFLTEPRMKQPEILCRVDAINLYEAIIIT